MGETQTTENPDFDYQKEIFTPYTVKAGDTLSSIAYARLNDARWAAAIQKINSDVVSTADEPLAPGTRLRLPVPIPPDAARRINLFHTISNQGPSTWDELIHYYFSIETGYHAPGFIEQKRREIANANRRDPHEPLEMGEQLLVPGIQATGKLGQKSKPLYEFNSVNVWGRRWVNLMRGIKTTHGVAGDLLDLANGTLVITKGQEPEDSGSTGEDPVSTNQDQNQSNDNTSPLGGTLSGGLGGLGGILAAGEMAEDSSVEEGGKGMSEIRTSIPVAQTNAALKALERDQLLVIKTLLANLGTFTDMEIGPCVASLTPPHWKPTYQQKSPPNSYLRDILNAVSQDLEYLGNALYQRQRGIDADGEMQMSIQAQSLYQADRLAASAIAPFQHLLPSDEGTSHNAVTYYTENMHIRQIPYDKSTVLIGLPYVTVSTHSDWDAYDELTKNHEVMSQYDVKAPFDYMAIPHEVGHFVFHFGNIRGTNGEMETIRDHLVGQLNTLQNANLRFRGWFEEIFADTVGIFVGGPLAVLGIQSLLVDAYIEEFMYDDGHHPLSAVRPFIMTKILEKMSSHGRASHTYTNAPDLLDKNWDAILREGGVIDPAIVREQTTLRFNTHANHKSPIAAHHFSNRRAGLALRGVRSRYDLIQEMAQLESLTIGEILSGVQPMIDLCVDLVMAETDGQTGNAWSVWSQDIMEKETLQDYQAVLENLINLDFEYQPQQQKVQVATKLDSSDVFLPQHKARARVIELMNGWGDSGPGGWGTHTGG